jgi:hypothetical protein
MASLRQASAANAAPPASISNEISSGLTNAVAGDRGDPLSGVSTARG